MKRIWMIATCLLWFHTMSGQEIAQYNRASIYPIYVFHPGTRMADEIVSTCLDMPIPDKYNDHRLSVRALQGLSVKAKEKEVQAALVDFMQKNQVGKRLVAKWFERKKATGECFTDLIASRAAYSVSAREMMQAQYTVSGMPVLRDADEELIPNTFVLVSDISYIDKEEKALMASGVFFMVGTAAEAAGGIASASGSSSGSSIGDLAKSVSDLGGSISDMVAGFTVDISTYLFQLKWDAQTANDFYQKYYCDSTSLSLEKKRAFENDKTTFGVEYIGSYTARSDKAVLRGLHSPEDVFRKVLMRAQDKNIVALQRKYPQFKVTDVVSAVLPNNEVEVQIGLKEGVSAKSKYEVLERVYGNDGQISYVRRGVLKPVAEQIWDNRYMSVEEEAPNATLGATRFKLTGDANHVYAGMLVREIR